MAAETCVSDAMKCRPWFIYAKVAPSFLTHAVVCAGARLTMQVLKKYRRSMPAQYIVDHACSPYACMQPKPVALHAKSIWTHVWFNTNTYDLLIAQTESTLCPVPWHHLKREGKKTRAISHLTKILTLN